MTYAIYFPAVISIFAYLIASLNIQRHVFAPAPVPRAIWMTASCIGLIALLQTDASQVSIYLATGLSIGSVVLFLFSIQAKYINITGKDAVGIIGMVICLSLWYLTDSAFIALVAILITDAIAILLNIWKTWQNPYFEDVTFWAVLFTGSFASLLAVLDSPTSTYSSLMYVLYFTASQFIMFGVVIVRLIILESSMSSHALSRLKSVSTRSKP